MANVESDYLDGYAWQKVVREALLELNPKALPQKVADAETAIFERLQALANGHGANGNNAEERQALQDAVNSLRVLKRETLKFPDWRPE
jgi:hypothetical protein